MYLICVIRLECKIIMENEQDSTNTAFGISVCLWMIFGLPFIKFINLRMYMYIFVGCPLGFFGEKCQTSCGKCQNGVCDHVTGRCTTGCKPGWTGLICIDSESFSARYWVIAETYLSTNRKVRSQSSPNITSRQW